jgi:acetyl-CoA synthetase
LAAELVAHVRQELGPIATPSAIRFTAKLPKTRSGKIMRRLLKAQETGQDLGDVTTLEE